MDYPLSLGTGSRVGRISSVRGSRATIDLEVSDGERVTVGAFLAIEAGGARPVGMITEIASIPALERGAASRVTATVRRTRSRTSNR